MNRSTIFEFLRRDTELNLRYSKIGTGSYPVLVVPDNWDKSYLIINKWRITDFQSIMLFSKELVVRFSIFDDMQINIPYKDIEYIEVHDEIDIGYMSLHNNEREYY